MASKHQQVLSVVSAGCELIAPTTAKRNEELSQAVLAGGHPACRRLGQPDGTFNPEDRRRRRSPSTDLAGRSDGIRFPSERLSHQNPPSAVQIQTAGSKTYP